MLYRLKKGEKSKSTSYYFLLSAQTINLNLNLTVLQKGTDYLKEVLFFCKTVPVPPNYITGDLFHPSGPFISCN